MNRVARTDELLAQLSKPLLVPTAPPAISNDDCLIISAGFEERALGVLGWAIQTRTQPFHILVVEYLPHIPENRISQIRDLCLKAGIPWRSVAYDRQNPSGFADLFSKEIESANGRLLVDVSAMSRLLVVQILVALGTRDQGFYNCSVAYCEATEYPPAAEDVEQAISRSQTDPLYSIMLLSSGVFDVTVVPELSSVSLDGQQSRLVAFPSFNAEQLMALRAELQPSRYSIVHGVPPRPENQWRTNAIARLNHLENMRGEEAFETSTLDYRETLDTLLRIYAVHGSTERILIAPTGSKMQAVAVGVFRSFVRDVQIVYPTPREFTSPSAYTFGIEQIYHLVLDAFVLPSPPNAD